jgi:hypothetical protein
MMFDMILFCALMTHGNKDICSCSCHHKARPDCRNCSSVEVVSWIGIVDGGYGANGLQAQVRFIPNSIRDVKCPHARAHRR